jgi:aryl-alcohol dehydrogenase-like predicted oxidoreductase
VKTRKLGGTGLSVGCIGLGGMSLSIDGRPDEAQSLRVIHAALDAGVTLIDTANVYCLDDADVGHNERLIAKALKSRRGKREDVVVATKGGLARPSGDWKPDGDPKRLKRACEASLKALGVEAIALYQLHAPDPAVPFFDTLGALAELRKEGKVLHLGLSNVSAEQTHLAERFFPVASVQNRCSVFHRESFHDGTVAYCEERGIAFLPYGPVGGRRGAARTPEEPTLKAVAARAGATPYQVCLAWLLAKSPAMIPIPGARRAESAASSAAAAELTLGRAELAELERAFPTKIDRPPSK